MPTPLEPLPRLSALLGGSRLWIKRDDGTGLAQPTITYHHNGNTLLDRLLGATVEIVSRETSITGAAEQGVQIGRVLHATGGSGTQAGLIVGFDSAQSGVRVLGMTVGRPKANQEANVAKLVDATADLLGVKPSHDNIEANDSYFGEAYGMPTPGMIEAVRLLAETESVLLDPVYSGKAMAGLIDLVRKGAFGKDENIVFVHTGGQAGLFAYEPAFAS